MKRFAIRNIATGGYLTGDYTGAPETNNPGDAKLWVRRGSLVKRIKNLTYDYHCDQAHQAGLHSNTYTGSGQAVLSVISQGTMTPVYEIVEIDFSPTVVSASVVNATVGSKAYGPITLAEIS